MQPEAPDLPPSLRDGGFLVCIRFCARIMDVLKLIDRWRFPVPIVYSDDYWMPNVGQHVFPAKKYRALYERLLLLGARKEQVATPGPAADEDILLVHTPRYVKRLKTGTLSGAEIAMLEL